MKTLQNLNLKIGQLAKCVAGYPKKSTVIIECIKDFETAKNKNDIVNNSYDYIRIFNSGKFGLLTSHLISDNWISL